MLRVSRRYAKSLAIEFERGAQGLDFQFSRSDACDMRVRRAGRSPLPAAGEGGRRVVGFSLFARHAGARNFRKVSACGASGITCNAFFSLSFRRAGRPKGGFARNRP